MSPGKQKVGVKKNFSLALLTKLYPPGHHIAPPLLSDLQHQVPMPITGPQSDVHSSESAFYLSLGKAKNQKTSATNNVIYTAKNG